MDLWLRLALFPALALVAACGGSTTFVGEESAGAGGGGAASGGAASGGVASAGAPGSGVGGGQAAGSTGVAGSATGGAAGSGTAGGAAAGSGSTGASCTVGGKTYPSGTGGFLGPDGCNKCSCLDGKLACTLLACVPPPPKLCAGIAGIACDKGQYCLFPPSAQCGAGDQSGECSSIPSGCSSDFTPVCGCDAQEYGNACTAAIAGVSVAHTGPCETTPPGSCSVTVDGAVYPDGTTNIPAGDGCNVCDCTKGALICSARPCKAPTPCGAREGGSCAADEYCAYMPGQSCGAADAASVCKPRPSACSTLYQPVCACDGKPYPNGCSAALAGSGVLRSGACSGT